MSLGRRLINTGAAACTTDSVDPFGDSSGVLLYSMDYDASDASGTADGSPTDVTFGVEGQINTGARFNGTSSFVNTNYTLTTDTTFSFSWWMNADSPTSNHYIFNDGNGTGHDGSLAIYHNTSGQLGMWIGANGSGYAYGLLTITGGLSGSWMHFAVSVNGSTATVYKNGSSAGTISLTPHSTAGILTLIIGRLGHFNGYYFKGDLDQIRYFNKAISPDEVSLLYAETACVYTATTTDNDYPTTNTAYYKLDNSAEDEKGSYDGTETNIEYRFGRFGQAAVFNGSNSAITLGTDIFKDANITFSAWINPNVSNTSVKTIYGNTSYVNGQSFHGIIISARNDSGVDKVFVQHYPSGTAVYSAGSISLNGYTHIAVSYGSQTKIYINGSLDSTHSASVSYSSGQTLTASLGAYILQNYTGSTPTSSFSGSIDQVRIFTSALSSSQVTELYNEKPATDTSNFKAVLYEGNGGTNFISNVGFQPDLVWVKARDDAHDHVLYDTVRGVGSGKALSSNANYTEGLYDAVYGFLDTFEATGFVAKIGSSFANYTNKNNESYAAWCWKGGGDAVSNTVGDITSTVSANPNAGFSIVKYTPPSGGSVYTNTVGHGLSSSPEIIIQKPTGINVDWYVHTSLIDGSNDYLVLNSVAAKGNVTQNFAKTSTTFTDWGWNGNEMINYCFHSVAGYSKMGSYTGDGTTSGKIIYTTDDGTSSGSNGFEPSFLLTKPVGPSGGYWYILDNRRSTTNPRNDALFPNDNLAEIESTNYNVDFLSNGFELKNNTIGYNTDNEDYIYMAFK